MRTKNVQVQEGNETYYSVHRCIIYSVSFRGPSVWTSAGVWPQGMSSDRTGGLATKEGCGSDVCSRDLKTCV
jgi:hypothetical protein